MSGALYGIGLPVGFVATLIFWGLPIAGLISVSSLSRVAFYQAKSSKTAWIVILAVGLLLSPVGFFFALYYFVSVRRRVRRFDVRSRS